MRSSEERIDVSRMPDWYPHGAEEIERIGWHPTLELGNNREPAPRTAHAQVP